MGPDHTHAVAWPAYPGLACLPSPGLACLLTLICPALLLCLAAGHAIVVLDSGGLVLRRAWPLFEAWQAAVQLPEEALVVVAPCHLEESTLVDWLADMDVEQAEVRGMWSRGYRGIWADTCRYEAGHAGGYGGMQAELRQGDVGGCKLI